MSAELPMGAPGAAAAGPIRIALDPGRAEHLRASTFHGRRGAVRHGFRYGLDMVLLDPEAPLRGGPLLFSRNRANLAQLRDRDHGGPPGQGRGAVWLREVLAARGIAIPELRILLLAQPRLLGHVFNPVSFWFCLDGQGLLRAVLAEVTNTFGDRHSYLCHHADLRPIAAGERFEAAKVFHVSPFQPCAGRYCFGFDITDGAVAIRIDYDDGAGGGLCATLTGRRASLRSGAILAACLARPFGSRRVLALIHWEALRLWLRRAPYRRRPVPPAEEVTR